MGGFKCMYPGSNHGLVYEPNPDHHRGKTPYRPGAHNFMRLYDAGVECPVCGHEPTGNSGCLVSSEDPEDPKAAICIRKKSDREQKLGWLHVLKEEGRVANAPPLPPSDDPVIVVEGMTDTAAAMDLGFVAVGRPSNRAGMGPLKQLLRNRSVIVVGENDEAGRDGMAAVHQTLKGVATEVRQVLPPEHLKDLRQWASADGLTREGLLEYAEEHGYEPEEQKVLPDGKSLTMAKAYLDARHRLNGRYLLRFDRGRWFRFNGVKYAEVSEGPDIRGPIYNWADDKQVLHVTPKGEEVVKPLECHKGTVNNIMDALYDPCPIDAEPPCWLNGVDGPTPDDLMVFQNGILWISRFLDGADEDQYLLPLTPDFFSTFALPFAFDPTAKCRRWRNLVKTNLDRDYDKVAMTQEWYGLNLTPITKYQKMMLMRGPAGAGKSLMATILGKLVGKEQWVAPKFADLTSDFGLQSLVGSQVAIMDEAKIPNSTDAMSALETILKITGEGTFDVPRKYLEALKSYKFATKFTLTCNELPNLPDHSGAMKRRLLILDFPRSFAGKADPDLESKLSKELPGIVLWSLEGLKRLREQGGFTVPKDMNESLREWQTTTSPMASFVEECCDEHEDAEITKEELYDAWTTWSTEHGMRPISKSRFRERIKANTSLARSDSYTKGGHKFSVFRGIKLQPWAERKLLGKPS
jgi:P4 family phage/plasmid primase-like protien